MSSRAEVVERAIAPVRRDVVEHPIAGAIQTMPALRRFMEHHVFAVWDFMWLLGELRSRFTCPQATWIPPASAVASRLVNEIAVGEESDDHPRGGFIWHFGWYVEAMHEVGADTIPIHDAHFKVAAGARPLDALAEAGAPAPSLRFARTSWAFTQASDATLVGAFCFGRETLIPDMFTTLQEGQGGLFADYLRRHIEIDAHHGKLTELLVREVCGSDPAAWLHLIGGARSALVARRQLWDDTLTAIQEHR